MKLFKKIAAGLFIICLLAGMVPMAAADNDDASYGDEFYAGKTWDDVAVALFEKYDVDPDRISLGYYNTVTGEEHFHNPDKYMVAGSMFKVPLNMLFTEKISKGEMDWDDNVGPYKYSELLKGSIIHSDNEYAKVLWKEAGTWLDNSNSVYHRYRELICPYMGEDPATVDPKFYENNFITARQMTECIKTLFAEPDRFPKLMETMQQAEPKNYFKLKEKRFDIGHKYGFLLDGQRLYMCDCGFAFTDDPIVMVMFTDGVNKAYDVMADYAVMMCDYTQYNTAKRLENEKIEAAKAEAEAKAQAEAEQKKAQEAAQMMENNTAGEKTDIPQTSVEVPESEVKESHGIGSVVSGIFVVIALIAALAAVLRISRKKYMKTAWAVASIVLCAAAVILCIVGVNAGTLIAKPDGDPQQCAVDFMDSITTGNYEHAYSLLKGYSGLGLENEPSDEAGKIMYDALKKSYSYSLTGDCIVDLLEARQQIQFNYLDLPATEDDIQIQTMNELEKIVNTRSKSSVYDSHNNYLPEVTKEAYTKAVQSVLANAEKYYTSTGIQLQLEYNGDGWFVIPAESLLMALSGNTSK